MAEEARARLGRGLAALIGDPGVEAAPPAQGQRRVPIEHIFANPNNPRRSFSEDELEELAESIRQKGIIQPIVVRNMGDQPARYQIIAGERRWRAAQRAGLHNVPVVEIKASDHEALEIAIIENVQRSDLNPVEEARGYQRLIDQFNRTQADVAKLVGKSRSHVANTMRILSLPDDVLARVEAKQISAGHARALLAVDDPAAMARQIVEKGLNVREVESMSASSPALNPKPRLPARQSDPNLADVENRLANALGLKISIKGIGQGGELRIRYSHWEQLDHICELLS